MDPKDYLSDWKLRYKKDLIENILPFWMQYGWDKQHGGCLTSLSREGGLIDSNKSVWFQGRFAFICAFAYNHIEQNQTWLEASKNTIDFIENHCFDTDGRMFFEVTREGAPVRKRRYVFSEAFAAIAFSEYAIASGDKTYAQKALDLFKRIQYLTETPGKLEPKFCSSVQMKGHSLTMILINTASRIREAIEDPALIEQINRSILTIRKDFMKPEFNALLETVGPSGEFINSTTGRMINPGHCIETAWFILEEAKYRKWDPELVKMGTTILDWSWEWGWDNQNGGINNFKDCLNLPSQDCTHDMKFWWPHAETIIATLYAFQATGDSKYLEMHKQVSEYTYTYFPDNEYGEWYGYLHYDGTVSQTAKGNMFKGPFHIPRMLVKSHQLCDEILTKL